MIGRRYIIQIYPSDEGPKWAYIVLRCSAHGARRVASATARNRMVAWCKASAAIAVLRHQERKVHANPVRDFF